MRSLTILSLTVMALSGCGTTSGGGGGGAAYTGGPPGLACQAASQSMGCVVNNSSGVPVYQVVRCDAAGNVWVLVSACVAGQICQEQLVPGAPGQKTAQCVSYGAGTPTDAGPSDGHLGGQDSLAGPGDAVGQDSAAVDAGSLDSGAVDSGAGDTGPVDPCSKCFPGQQCIDHQCVNPDPCSKCTGGQTCIEGKCVDATLDCKLPTSGVSKNVQKLTTIAIADSKVGCDVDGDGTPDNVFGALKTLVPADSLQASIDNGDMVLLLHAASWTTSGVTFQIDALSGELDKDQGCKPSGPGCDCLVSADVYDTKAKGDLCPAKTQFNAKVVGNKMTGTSLSPVIFPLPLMGTTSSLTLHKASLEGTVSGPSSWTSTTNGLLCGAMKQKEVMNAVDAMPDSTFKELGIDKEMAKSILASMLTPDIDVDGDGSKESVSVALATSTASAQFFVETGF